jgi:methionyl-tRNA formyltransferase
MKIVFFGTSDIGLPILEDLIANHQVLAVVTSPDKPVGRKQELTPTPIAELAKQHKIQILKPKIA